MTPFVISIICACTIIGIGSTILYLDGVRLRRALRSAQRLAEDARKSAVQCRKELEFVATASTWSRFRRRRVMVNAIGGAHGWRGVLEQELDDALILRAVDVIEVVRGGQSTVEHVPGEVVIPVVRIDYVQVLSESE